MRVRFEPSPGRRYLFYSVFSNSSLDHVAGPAGSSLMDILFDFEFGMAGINKLMSETLVYICSLRLEDFASQASVLAAVAHEVIFAVTRIQEDLLPIVADFRGLLKENPSELVSRGVSVSTVIRALEEDEMWAVLLVITEGDSKTADQNILSILDGRLSGSLMDVDSNGSSDILLPYYTILRRFLRGPDVDVSETGENTLVTDDIKSTLDLCNGTRLSMTSSRAYPNGSNPDWRTLEPPRAI
jgi:hypothetical protein